MSLVTDSVNFSQSEILNGNSDISLKDVLSKDNTKILKSEDDEQLILNIRFNENVKLSSIKFVSPDGIFTLIYIKYTNLFIYFFNSIF